MSYEDRSACRCIRWRRIHFKPVFCRFVLSCQIFLPPIKTVGCTTRQRKMLPVKLWFINVYTYHNPKPTLTVIRVPTLSWTPDSRTFKDFFKHHLFYIKHLSNSHPGICSVMKDLTVLNISLTLNIYIKTFRVMFWMCKFHKFRPFWAVVFKGIEWNPFKSILVIFKYNFKI